MDVMSQNKRDFSLAMELGKLLDEHKGGNVVVMDLRSLNSWTDFFVIATVTSNTHLGGLQRHVKDFVQEKGLEILRRSRKPEKNAGKDSADPYSAELRSDEWCLLDLGSIVVHLMSPRLRSFYELERLWSSAPLIFNAQGQSSGSGT